MFTNKTLQNNGEQLKENRRELALERLLVAQFNANNVGVVTWQNTFFQIIDNVAQSIPRDYFSSWHYSNIYVSKYNIYFVASLYVFEQMIV